MCYYCVLSAVTILKAAMHMFFISVLYGIYIVQVNILSHIAISHNPPATRGRGIASCFFILTPVIEWNTIKQQTKGWFVTG